MLKRLLWLGIGIGVGVVAVRTVTKRVSAFSPAGLAGQAHESLSGVAGSVRGLLGEIRDGMAAREDDIREHFAEGIALDTPQLPWARDVGQRFAQFKQRLEDE